MSLRGAWHIQQPQGRQWVEVFTPTAPGSKDAPGGPAYKRMTRRVRAKFGQEQVKHSLMNQLR